MKVKEITVGTSRKLGLPGYSSFDVSAFVTVELGKNDDPQEAYNKAWVTIEKQVISRIESKGLESPVAAEAQKPEEKDDWLEHESPEEQKGKIKSAKKSKVMKDNLAKVKGVSIPSVRPTTLGGD